MNLDLFKNTKILTLFLISFSIAISGVLFFYFFSSNSMEPLYYNLNEEDAAKIVEKLKENSIKYQLRNNGKTILVESSKIPELRLMLASSGLPSKSETGFELFDKTKFGLSSFAERINYRRALEGELSRTISSISGVKFAKVHIALPEPDIFSNKIKAASASIILHTSENFNLSQSQIKGIIHLVAGAVEGLNPNNISITDGNGRLLKPAGQEIDFDSDLKKRIENDIEQKVKTALQKIAGYDNFVVTADIVLDLDVLETVKEIYNPNPVVRSSQNSSEETTSNETKTRKSSSETKYEIDKTIEKYIKKPGTIKRISLSVVISTEIAETEIENIKEIVSSSAGMDPKRGDSITIKRLPFIKNEPQKNLADEEYIKLQKELEKQKTLREAIKYTSVILGWSLFGIFVFLAVKNLNKTKTNETNQQAFLNIQNQPILNAQNKDSKQDNLETNNKLETSRDIKKEFIEKASKNPHVLTQALKDYLKQPQTHTKEAVNAG